MNPAEPPMIMRDTVLMLTADADQAAIIASVEQMVSEVAAYVPGYRLKQEVQIEPVDPDAPLSTLVDADVERPRWKVSVFLDVEGVAHYLPASAGNPDIMTSAALRTAERMVEHRQAVAV